MPQALCMPKVAKHPGQFKKSKLVSCGCTVEACDSGELIDGEKPVALDEKQPDGCFFRYSQALAFRHQSLRFIGILSAFHRLMIDLDNCLCLKHLPALKRPDFCSLRSQNSC